MSFDAFKDLFKDKFSIDTLKAAFDAVRNKNPDLSSFVNNIDTSKLGDLAAAVGAVATGVALLKKDNISQLFSSLDGSEGFGDINQELVTMNKLMGVLTLRPTELAANVVQEAFNQATIYLQQQTALVDYMNNKIGLTGELSEHFRDEITKASPEVLRMGVSFEQLSQFSGGLVENTGKFLMLSSQGLVKATETSQAYVGSLSELGEMLPKFTEVGYGFEDATDHIAKIGKDSMEIALRSQTVTKQVGENVGKLNQYGFKNGIDGLGKMVQKSIEFRTNMESTFAIADKTMDITDSINLSAELTALGGAVGDFLDPFKLSYMAVNDVEGLQDALLGMSKSLATYNSETNKYEVTGVNLRLARSQAQALGVDLATLTNSAIAGAERQQVHNDLMARGLTMSKEQQEFITNMSQMKDGSMQLEISDNLAKQLGVKDNSVRIQDLNQQQLDTILKMQDEIKKYQVENQVVTTSFNIDQVARAQTLLSNIPRGLLVGTMPKNHTSLVNAKQINADVQKYHSSYNPAYRADLIELLEITKHRGISFWPWALNDETFKKLYLAGSYGITTNSAQLYSAYVVDVQVPQTVKIQVNQPVQVTAQLTQQDRTQFKHLITDFMVLSGAPQHEFKNGQLIFSEKGTAYVLAGYKYQIDSQNFYQIFSAPMKIVVK